MPITDLTMRFAAREQTNVESVVERLDLLTRERQNLRDRRAASDTLEENRLAIVRAQWELSRALIDRYLPAPKAA